MTDRASSDVEAIARHRLRSLRQSFGWSLDELAERSHLSASTISRIETGKRSIGIDVLVALATALQTDVASLLDMGDDADIVIRPIASHREGATVWPLSRPTSTTIVTKVRLEPTERDFEPKVHAGHDWFFVLTGRVRLTLGERDLIVEAGQAAEFSTEKPHAIDAVDGPAEMIMVYDGDGRRAHLHDDAD